ncbi:MAG: glycerophosphodiester phosphodiesterase family protein [Rikenellaceae bacterium]
MKRIFATLALLSITSLSIMAQTKVIAHRGYWNCEGSAQNSITALQNSAKIGVYGSEFDVLITRDGVLVVNHDNTINGIDIQKVDYSEIKDLKISNGETFPTLEEYLIEGKKHPRLKLILELKPHYTKQAEDRAVEESMRLVKKHEIEEQVEFISFSKNICEGFAALTSSPVSYLNGDIEPEEIAKTQIDGIDYHYKVFAENRQWISSAATSKIITNSWTVNDLGVAKALAEAGIDYLTTDYPEEILMLIQRLK